MDIQLSEEELNERVALLKRFKELLEKQRQKFKDYLNVLEKQQTVIQNQDTEALLVHTEIEQQIVANIQNLQKVIEPIEQMYIASSLDSEKNNLENSTNKIKEQKTQLIIIWIVSLFLMYISMGHMIKINGTSLPLPKIFNPEFYPTNFSYFSRLPEP